jgi:glycosyltransferase involved in cell wall biosynthesis
METKLPLVSIIMATFNRAHTIERAINSVLNQSYQNIELIIIDDGSTDNTSTILKNYDDPRIRIHKHEHNRGVTAAKNSGLKLIKGEWFTTFDSDDEMMPDAIRAMMNVPLYFDQTITSVTCNCWEPISNSFSGQGLTEDCHIKANEIMPLCKGDFWGLNKTSLLMGESFNENLIGVESTLWYKVNERANGYYIHKALNIIHLEGDDRVTKLKAGFEKKILHYESLINEEFYLKITKKYKPDEFYNICKTGLLMMRLNNNKYIASQYYELLKSSKNRLFTYLIFKYRLIVMMYKFYLKLKPSFRKMSSSLRSAFF